MDPFDQILAELNDSVEVTAVWTRIATHALRQIVKDLNERSVWNHTTEVHTTQSTHTCR